MKAQPPTLLVIDDEPFIRAMLIDALENYLVRAFVGGPEAIEWMTEHPREQISVVISDYHLDGPDGIDVCKRVRELQPHVKCILITGSASPNVEALAKESGLDGFIRKPFLIPDLQSTVDRLVESVQLPEAPVAKVRSAAVA